MYWRDEWRRWEAGAYRAINAQEIRAELTSAIRAEFVRLNPEEVEAALSGRLERFLRKQWA